MNPKKWESISSLSFSLLRRWRAVEAKFFVPFVLVFRRRNSVRSL